MKVRHYLLVGGRRRRWLRMTVTVTAAVDSGRWLQTLTFDGRGVTAASGAAALVGDDDDNNKWGGALECATC